MHGRTRYTCTISAEVRAMMSHAWKLLSILSFVVCVAELWVMADNAQYPGSAAARKKVCLAAREGWVEEIERLRLKGVSLDQPCGSYRQSPLTLAVNNGHDNVVEYLLRWRVDPNQPDRGATSPLLRAERILEADLEYSQVHEPRHVRIVQLLREAGGVSRSEINDK